LLDISGDHGAHLFTNWPMFHVKQRAAEKV
jgi:hypothetical protein